MSFTRTGIWIVALSLGFLLNARAEGPKCESEAVQILYNWGMSLKNADEATRPRAKLDAEAKRLESSGFFRRCGELKNRLMSQMDIIGRLDAGQLAALMKEASPSLSLKSMEKLALQHSTAPTQPGSDKCNAVAGLCKQDYELLFGSFREIGGPVNYEPRCVKAKDTGKACKFLVNMKNGGIDNNTNPDDFISKHGSCHDVSSSCSAVKFKMFKEYLQKIFDRNTHSDPVKIEFAVTHKFESLSECRDRLQEQKDIPDSEMRIEGTIDQVCRAIYRAAIKQKKLDACAKGEVNSECPPCTVSGNANECSSQQTTNTGESISTGNEGTTQEQTNTNTENNTMGGNEGGGQ